MILAILLSLILMVGIAAKNLRIPFIVHSVFATKIALLICKSFGFPWNKSLKKLLANYFCILVYWRDFTLSVHMLNWKKIHSEKYLKSFKYPKKIPTSLVYFVDVAKVRKWQSWPIGILFDVKTSSFSLPRIKANRSHESKGGQTNWKHVEEEGLLNLSILVVLYPTIQKYLMHTVLKYHFWCFTCFLCEVSCLFTFVY